MARILTLLAVLLGMATPAVAGFVEMDGYRYLEISLGGLWKGFFVFLVGIFFILVGLFIYFVWRKSLRERGQPAEAPKEEDEQVF